MLFERLSFASFKSFINDEVRSFLDYHAENVLDSFVFISNVVMVRAGLRLIFTKFGAGSAIHLAFFSSRALVSN